MHSIKMFEYIIRFDIFLNIKYIIRFWPSFETESACCCPLVIYAFGPHVEIRT